MFQICQSKGQDLLSVCQDLSVRSVGELVTVTGIITKNVASISRDIRTVQTFFNPKKLDRPFLIIMIF
ncbi:MAG: hypothetical protein EOO34_00425 [Cyanobacteriota bacterium]|nr:MAG: hypothetical protein EOO34_00425 [Cyanobacteriota bacterium]